MLRKMEPPVQVTVTTIPSKSCCGVRAAPPVCINALATGRVATADDIVKSLHLRLFAAISLREKSSHRSVIRQGSFGWPLDMKTGGGSFLYHLEDNQVAVGFVVHLNYKNPYLYPFEEFQRFKTHPAIAPIFEGGKRLSYGARSITEGGYQSVPKLTFPGGALIGCSAGLVNVPRIKGSHNAVLSGMLAADKLAEAIASGRANDEVVEIENEWRDTAIGKDLKRVRNVKPLWSKLGTVLGVGLGGLDMWTNQLFGFSFFGTLKHGKTDAQSLEPAKLHKKIDCLKPDGVLTFAAAICGRRAPWSLFFRKPTAAAGMRPSAIEPVPRPPLLNHRRRALPPWMPGRPPPCRLRRKSRGRDASLPGRWPGKTGQVSSGTRGLSLSSVRQCQQQTMLRPRHRPCRLRRLLSREERRTIAHHPATARPSRGRRMAVRRPSSPYYLPGGKYGL